MAYTREETERLLSLCRGIEARKPHKYAAPTYRDTRALGEIMEVVKKHTERDSATLKVNIKMLEYLADCYDKMCRSVNASLAYSCLISAYVALAEISELIPEEKDALADILYSAIRARNRYIPDECEDIISLSASLLGEEANSIALRAKEWAKKQIKQDKVELSEEYLDVIDEVEAEIEKRIEFDTPHEYWSIKRELLEERGIRWRSPAVLNPRTKFD